GRDGDLSARRGQVTVRLKRGGREGKASAAENKSTGTGAPKSVRQIRGRTDGGRSMAAGETGTCLREGDR
ncbi:MAG: hypothetical protein MPK07_04870, partial [Alphaproteobacteria bacterium]|nr:hypothetical protein [Alphaproteobacteria bacterium]